MNIAQLWDICIPVMWDNSYIVGLDKFLKSKNIKTVLDSAGGTGFPSIALKKLGWDITYSDKSDTMLSFFKEAAIKEGIELPSYQSEWSQLSKDIGSKFDALLCRGNSLVYVDSWDSGVISEVAKENIKRSLSEFFRILNPNGLAYIDIINENEYDRSDYPIVEKFSEKILDGKKVNMVWEVNHDYKTHLRTIKITLDFDGRKEDFMLYSFLLRHDELVSFLKEVGFSKIEKANIEGEKNYTVFVAYK